MRFDAGRDLQIVEAMAADFKAYLLSAAVYWALPRRGPLHNPFPSGTLGGTLLRLHYLAALSTRLDLDHLNRVGRARMDIEAGLSQWVVQAEHKAVAELNARLRQWGQFIEECERRAHRDSMIEYRTQADNRTAILFLSQTAGRSLSETSLTTRVTVLDKRLSDLTERGPFVWDEALSPAFPTDPFWWLYIAFKT
jgi:hypothetical protein